MKTLIDVLKLASQYLVERGESRGRRQAEELLAHVLKISRLDLYLQFDRPLEERELAAYREYIKRKALGEPLEYILGEVNFYGCSLQVDRSVLIPRPETELLLDRLCVWLQKKERKELVAWDICCGSGSLGIGLKRKFPEIAVTLSDISSEALSVARANGVRNSVDLTFLEGDLLAPFVGQKANLIVCNPPYVSLQEWEELDKGVRLFEPKQALVASGERGEEFYERLARELPLHLHPGARVFLEIGSTQGDLVREIFSASGWVGQELQQDLAGHDRFFFLEWQ